MNELVCECFRRVDRKLQQVCDAQNCAELDGCRRERDDLDSELTGWCQRCVSFDKLGIIAPFLQSSGEVCSQVQTLRFFLRELIKHAAHLGE